MSGCCASLCFKLVVNPCPCLQKVSGCHALLPFKPADNACLYSSACKWLLTMQPMLHFMPADHTCPCPPLFILITALLASVCPCLLLSPLTVSTFGFFQIVGSLHKFTEAKSHFFTRKSWFYNCHPFKMWYLHTIPVCLYGLQYVSPDHHQA